MSSNKFALAESHGQLHGVVKTTTVTVSGGPTLLPAAALKDRKDVTLHNAGSIAVYIGGAGVTIADGIPLASGADLRMEFGRAEVYAVASGINQLVRVLEVS